MKRGRNNLPRRGYALPAVLLFIIFAFGTWTVYFRGSTSVLRIEQARVVRETRDIWTSSAMATALRLLQSGAPPADPYSCKLTLSSDGQTKYFLLSYEQISATRWSVSAAPTTPDDPAVTAPSTFAVTPGTPAGLVATGASSGQINLTWSDVARDYGYLVERSANGTSSWIQVGVTARNAANYADPGLANNTTYYYRVRATNAGGNSGYSNVASASTSNSPIPNGLAATALSSSQIRLSWSDVANETGYKIERSVGSSAWVEIATPSAGVTTYTDNGLTAGTTYSYRVRSYDGGGSSGAGTTVTATPPANVLAAPGGLALAVNGDSISLSWTDNSSGETGFRIHRSTNGSTWTGIATTAANANTYTNAGLTSGTLYYYRVRAINAAGQSAWSNVASAAAN